MIAVLQKDAAEGRSHDALAYVAACSGQHDGMKGRHIEMKNEK
jgi:hypothetical protein